MRGTKSNETIIHLIVCDKFTAGVINYINDYFENNLFILYGSNNTFKREQIKNNNNVIDIDDINYFDLFFMFRKSEKIIIHSMFFSKKIFIFFTIFINLFSDLTWIPWGGDFYPFLDRENKSNIKYRIRHKLRCRIIKQIKTIAALTYGDFILIREHFNKKAKYCPINYYDQIAVNSLMEVCRSSISKENDAIINIIVGNSATKTNNHVDILKKLSRFSEENINIYCPLSYGDSEYAKEIVRIGKSLFKDKFKPILEYMNLNKYHTMLKSMDIAIFNNSRQQALGNIYANLALSTKVYIRSDTSMWEEIVKKNNFKVYMTESIEESSFSEFIKYDDKTMVVNKNAAIEYYSLDRNILMWEKLLCVKRKYDE